MQNNTSPRYDVSTGDMFVVKEEIIKKCSEEQMNRLWPCLFLEDNKLIISNETIATFTILKIIYSKNDIKKFIILASLKKSRSLIACAYTAPTIEHFDKICV